MAGIAIVNFRTLPNGGWKWVKKGQRRGYWRVLEVILRDGPTSINSRNVIRELWHGDQGIDGISDKSGYNLDYDKNVAQVIAERFNVENHGRVF